MTLTKACIVENICHRTGFSKKRSAKIFETLLETMKQALESGEEVVIRGFGKFSVKNNNRRNGRNASTDKTSALDANRLVFFRCSSALKKKINEERTG